MTEGANPSALHRKGRVLKWQMQAGKIHNLICKFAFFHFFLGGKEDKGTLLILQAENESITNEIRIVFFNPSEAAIYINLHPPSGEK